MGPGAGGRIPGNNEGDGEAMKGDEAGGRGRFITVEGVEGAGKTTHLPFIAETLSRAGHTVVNTREPGGTELGEALRGLLLDAGREAMCADSELLLMFAARAEHVDKVIRPALVRGDWVLCDRFTDATYAYQGGGRSIAEHRIAALEDWVQGKLRPDLTLILDVPLAVGRERIAGRNHADRFEREQADFFERVRAVYLRRAARFPSRYRVVDTSGGIDEARAGIAATLGEWLA
jgi:dTMP kinase